MKSVLYPLLLLLILIVIIGCIQKERVFVCPDGTTVDNLENCKEKVQSPDSSQMSVKSVPKTPLCPYECCEKGEFTAKYCGENFKCESNTCKPICKKITYFENIPKQITVPYTERVCVNTPYQETYQEEECHDEALLYTKESLKKEIFWTYPAGCVFRISVPIRNQDSQISGNFKVEFAFVNATGKSINKIVENNISPLTLLAFIADYDKGCFEANPEVTFTVTVPTKHICIMVTKVRDKVLEECHDEPQTKIETIFEKVERTETVCTADVPSICSKLDCNDKDECTDDNCGINGCLNIPKPNNSSCSKGICRDGRCIATQPPQTICTTSNCETKTNSICSGTIKVTTTYSCRNNVCVENIARNQNNFDCGYRLTPEVQVKSIQESLESIFNKFDEFKKINNGAAIDIFVWGDDFYTISKNSTGVTVQKSGSEGDISMVIPKEAITQLNSSSAVCSNLYSLIDSGVIKNVTTNTSTADLFLKNFCAMKLCIPATKVAEIKNCP